MRGTTLLLLAACSTPIVPGLDGGPVDVDAGHDAGPREAGPHDAGRPQACMPSTCDVGGAWQVGYRFLDGGGLVSRCSPTPGPLEMTSDGGTVCMVKANTGGSDGGCSFQFRVDRNGFDWSGAETWELHQTDAGGLAGSLFIGMAFPPCTASYSLDAFR